MTDQNPNRIIEPCAYLKQVVTGKQKFDCEERNHWDTNMVLENCFQDQGCCLNRMPKVLSPSEYPESKIPKQTHIIMEKPNFFVVPGCVNCYNGYFDETACFVDAGCPNPDNAGMGVCCDKYEGSVNLTDLRAWLMKGVIMELERLYDLEYDSNYTDDNGCLINRRELDAYDTAITLIKGMKND